MSGKRLKHHTPEETLAGLVPSIEPEPPAPQQVTCPACGATALLSGHACPHCRHLFLDRTRGKAPRVPDPSAPRAPDPQLQEFSARMARAERWTRLICTAVGVLFGAATVLSLAGFFRAMNIYGIALSALLSVVCLLRGLGRPGADEGFVGSLAGLWLPFRWRR